MSQRPDSDRPTALADGIALRLLLLALGVAAIGVSFPLLDVVFRMDEWDYLDQLLRMPFADYLLIVNPGGHRTPLAKALFAFTVYAGHFTPSVANLVNLSISLATVLVVYRILRVTGPVGIEALILLAALRANYVGVADVFSFPLTGCLQLALLFFFGSVLVLTRSQGRIRNNRELFFLALLVAAGLLSFGAGALVPMALMAGFAAARPSGQRLVDMLAGMTVLLVLQVVGLTLVHRPEVTRSGLDCVTIGRYFVYGTIINGALSGLQPLLIPGWIHMAFFAFLVAGATLTVIGSRSPERRFVAASLVSFQLITGVATAMARAPGAATLAHASSYRYVYVNLVLQVPLLIVLWQECSDRMKGRREERLRRLVLATSATLATMGFAGAWSARRALDVAETARRDCLTTILASATDLDCVTTVYLRPDAETIRRTVSEIERWRSRKAGAPPR